MHAHLPILPTTRALTAAVLWLAFATLVSACSDRAIIGALCPVGCQLRAKDNSCDCTLAFAGRGASGCAATGCASDAGDAGAISTAAPDAAESGSEECAPGAYPLTPALGNLVVAFDNSSSLLPWLGALSDGFLRLIQEDASRGLGVGLLGFAEVCEAAAYLPPRVALAPLPENLAALQDAAASSDTELSTSTVPVLSAALRYARDWSDAHADTRVAVLLISDASPGACDGLVGDYQAEAARLASEAYAATPAIATYAMGGDGLDYIKPIALAGGTQALQINTLASSDMVLEAMRGIRDTLRSCALSLPLGVKLAPDSQVISTSQDGAQRAFVVQRSASACQGEGFYVDDQNSPTPLHACPDTCAAVSGGELASTRFSLSSACKVLP